MSPTSHSRTAKIALGLVLGLLACRAAMAQGPRNKTDKNKTKSPNILLIIMDDVGIDQMKSFGYGSIPDPSQTGPNNIPPRMPNIDAIASGGVRFRNTWAMPECSPSRAVMFTGRYPLRSNILQAIGPSDLNNSHVATWEVTTPKLLKQANYSSGMFGKFHLGGPENNEFGDGAPASLGGTTSTVGPEACRVPSIPPRAESARRAAQREPIPAASSPRPPTRAAPKPVRVTSPPGSPSRAAQSPAPIRTGLRRLAMPDPRRRAGAERRLPVNSA